VSTLREAILVALQGLLQADSFFPDDVEIDAEEPKAWRSSADGLTAGLADAAAVQDCDKPEVTRDGGPDDVWELRGAFVIAYAVSASPQFRGQQRARRDLAERKIAELIALDRTLGLDPSVYAEVGPVERHNNAPIKATAPVATSIVTINVDFIAPSAAG
jgi:hypothetical protein